MTTSASGITNDRATQWYSSPSQGQLCAQDGTCRVVPHTMKLI